MAENDQTPKQEKIELDVLNEENKELKNDVTRGQKYVMWGMIAISVIAILVVIYIFAIRNPAVKSANEAVAQADITLMQGNDSLALAQYQQVAKEYGYDAGNNATLMAATLLYRKGEYQQAIDQLKDYSPKETIVGAAAKSLEGDCYVNLKKYDEALACYDKAIKVSDNNAYYTPLFMMKKATVLREQGKYTEELKVLENIRDNYPEYCNTYRFPVDKYISRAEYQAENAGK
ncbi:MAG: tetratricopeptide repeat protein [Muribaculum sp.]|nr:tetratricopeptide repeat protein [Muribaculaceae bacterium]MCM1081333.1 tetratricopeptide repeat protein [Muribaculum sp.]